MTLKLLALLILILPVTFASCNKATPAGFWKNYNSKFLVKNISNQGPRGGNRAIYWKADQPNIFSSTNLIAFADKNGWALVDSMEFSRAQVTKWIYEGKPIFPLSHTGFNDKAESNSIFKYFPRWFNGPIKVYRFKTGWITFAPGTDDSIEENGFVLLTGNKNEMAVYHLWGE